MLKIAHCSNPHQENSPFVFTDLSNEDQLKPLILAIQGGLYANPYY